MKTLDPGNWPSAGRLGARGAEALGAHLPPLLVAAQRVAATVAQGMHGRRRVGQGESFWQFRPFVEGDSIARIDWRQSAKSDRAFVRETEWEAAQTVVLWRDPSAAMRWRSRLAPTDKHARAGLLLLALAALLLRGGERVSLLGHRPVTGKAGLDALADTLARDTPEGSGLPPLAAIPRHAKLVLIGDFLSPVEEIQRRIAGFAAIPVSGHLLQVLDPAEASLPFDGRIRFRGLPPGDVFDGSQGKAAQEMLVPRVGDIRALYLDRLAAHQAALAGLAATAGFSIAVHHTDRQPEAALLGLYTALNAK